MVTNEMKLLRQAMETPYLLQRVINDMSFYDFFLYFWDELSADKLHDNWHIKYLCDEVQAVAERVGRNEPKEYDLIINVPPGTSKTSIIMKAFPVWCWTRWYYFRFITASYSHILSLESGEAARDLIWSDKFREMYPELTIKLDKANKSNYRIAKKTYDKNNNTYIKTEYGGNRYSTSVGGSVTGFHGHILIVDDPLNPFDCNSETTLTSTNMWIDQVISTRKVDKQITPLILIMQRLHQKDPTGHILSKDKGNVKHISLPAELGEYEKDVKPEHIKEKYIDGLLDPVRLNRAVLKELEADLGQYGYAGQIGQRPTPPGGGMFKVDNFSITTEVPQPHQIVHTVRYWDKAGTADAGAYTVGIKMCKINTGKFLVMDVKRGQWSTEKREQIILQTAQSDGIDVDVYIEQEPGSGGKESAENTIRNLAGFHIEADRPTGDKVFRADPYSVQVNNGNVMLLYGAWNHEFVEEHRFFPFSKYKDQVDGCSGSFSKLNNRKEVRSW